MLFVKEIGNGVVCDFCDRTWYESTHAWLDEFLRIGFDDALDVFRGRPDKVDFAARCTPQTAIAFGMSLEVRENAEALVF